MNCYGSLAKWYDQLTGDVPYGEFADLYEKIFREYGDDFSLILDLFCGTGTLSYEMAKRGYEMIAVDASEDMLMQAQSKSCTLEMPPLYLCQEAAELDLYGTVDAAYSSLDSINYIPPGELPELFRRLSLFVRPGGLFIFDIRSPEWLHSMDGQIYVDERDGVLCLWRAEQDGELLNYGMDIFSKVGKLWKREQEEHIEYIYTYEKLASLLSENKFSGIRMIADAPQTEIGRQFIIAVREE